MLKFSRYSYLIRGHTFNKWYGGMGRRNGEVPQWIDGINSSFVGIMDREKKKIN